MSFDDLHSNLSGSASSSGQLAAEALVDVELDVRMLASLVPESEEIITDDTELLARLDSAHTVAGGVEARLDDILSTLDDLLTSLEPKDADNSQEAARATPPETQPPSE
jgi:hypothetical protein